MSNLKNIVAQLPDYKLKLKAITSGNRPADELLKPEDFTTSSTSSPSKGSLSIPSTPNTRSSVNSKAASKFIDATTYWNPEDIGTCHFGWPIISHAEYMDWEAYAKRDKQLFEPGEKKCGLLEGHGGIHSENTCSKDFWDKGNG